MNEMLVIPRFDGGLNLLGSPIGIADHEWTWSDGFEPQMGGALQMTSLSGLELDPTWPPSGHVPVGLVENYINPSLTQLFVFTRGTSVGQVRVWLYDASVPSFTEQTVSGTWRCYPTDRFYQRPVVIGGAQLFCAGRDAVGSPSLNTCARYVTGSPGTATLLAPTNPLRGFAQVASGNHAIVSGDLSAQSLIRISDAGAMAAADWNPAISNTADELTLDAGLWRGMAPTTQGVVVLFDNMGFLLQPTGGDPPFNISAIGTAAGAVGYQQVVECPAGTVFLTRRGFSNLGGGIVPGSEKCVTLIAPQYSDPNTNLKLVYDTRRAALVSVQTGVAFGDPVETYFQPNTGAWFRRLLPTPGSGFPVDHAYTAQGTALTRWLLWSTLPDIYQDAYFFNGFAGHDDAFVDTKDFAFPNPSSNDEWVYIQVDWEELATSSAVEVYGYIRDELFPSGFTGSQTGETDYTAQFVLLGTLSGTTRQLKVRRRGRYARFRFKVTAGRVRIRGIAICRQRGSDRAAGFTVSSV